MHRRGRRRAHAMPARPFRFAARRARAEGRGSASPRSTPIGEFSRRRACRARRPAHLCRDHPGRPRAAASPAAQRERRQPAHHRRRDPRQSRADALEPGRPRRQPACRHRPHRDGRRRARACKPARQSARPMSRRVNARLDAVAYLAGEPRLRQTLARGAEGSARPCPRARAARIGTRAVRAISAPCATPSARPTRLPRSLARAGERTRSAARA